MWVSNPAKDGKDAGELAELGRELGRPRDHRPGRADRAEAGLHRAHRDGRRPGLRVHRRPVRVRRGRHQRRPRAARCCCSGRRRSCRRSCSTGWPRRAADRREPARQRHRPGLRQRPAAARAHQPEPAHRRGAGDGDRRLLDVLPAGRHGRHVRLRPADGLQAVPLGARHPHHGLGERRPPDRRRPRHRARRAADRVRRPAAGPVRHRLGLRRRQGRHQGRGPLRAQGPGRRRRPGRRRARHPHRTPTRCPSGRSPPRVAAATA